MASKQEVRRLIGSIGSNPQLINDLMKAPDQNHRKKLLGERGLIDPSQKGPSEQEIRQEIEELLRSTSAGGAPAAGERAVEWVAAIGTAAAGAAAGACTAE